ncbi:hypothetical protein [Chromobacterium sp. IIBBL 290-4]|uniref:hypothetical protein n=1 Tax=Chromobacterium sp. IIBBL 290-4 TaxID=2953890 RepID=UPI0020B6BB94|nr:hypothetical protein [Chromobacterium sp. IIBBL 290-4]UTH75001.1 hypothetical protein NKT35_02525 [Chromobacterium sp. IIBBL 290-4]
MIDHQDIRGPNRQLLPQPYLQMALNGANYFLAWRFVSSQDRSDKLRREFRLEAALPNSIRYKDIQPFAVSTYSDDIAGFLLDEQKVSKTVIVVHLTWSGKAEREGFPSVTVYEDFVAWLKECVCEDLRMSD